jgi:transcriptional regulator with XRE-family HTH domain
MSETVIEKSFVDKSLSQIGKLIAALRQERGITQQEFARSLGTTQSAIARIERGEQNLSTEMLAKISDALNRDIVQVSKGALNIKSKVVINSKVKSKSKVQKTAPWGFWLHLF